MCVYNNVTIVDKLVPMYVDLHLCSLLHCILLSCSVSSVEGCKASGLKRALPEFVVLLSRGSDKVFLLRDITEVLSSVVCLSIFSSGSAARHEH